MAWGVVVVRWRDEQGFSTPAMVVALLVALSLVFSSAQVYRVSSASADIQSVADAAALAAENEIAEFMILVRTCDAVILSLSLASTVSAGLGVAALCTPVTAGASEVLLDAAHKLAEGRDSFAQKAADGLNELQKALPFLAAANAASVASANNGGVMDARYLALAVLSPEEGQEIRVGGADQIGELLASADAQADDVREAASQADQAASLANEAKRQAFEHDCGSNPGYCMYERAATLAGLDGEENPLFRSIDSWSFSVALERAKAYYGARSAQEAPEGTSVEEQARSALRKRFYEYAERQVRQGYVRDDGETFEASFPHLPKDTAEMRATELYTEEAYPLAGGTLHAWSGCPLAGGVEGYASIRQMEEESLGTCPECGFSAESMGKVAAASTSIENGFEYHYEAVACAAEAYERARNELAPQAAAVKEQAGGLLEQCLEACEKVSSQRIDAKPPGAYGVVVLAANTAETLASTGFESSFVAGPDTLGARAAVSGATLLEDPSGEGASVISSLLDGVADEGGAAVGVMGVVLDCWAGLLQAYTNGQDAVSGALDDAINAIPFASESGLGSWAAGVLKRGVDALGLQPAELGALRPVTVNTGYVANADADSAFSARFLTMRARALSLPGSSSDLFSSVITEAEQAALDDLAAFDGTVELATIAPFGEEGPSVPLTITLPPSVREAAGGAIGGIADTLRGLYARVSGVRAWE